VLGDRVQLTTGPSQSGDERCPSSGSGGRSTARVAHPVSFQDFDTVLVTVQDSGMGIERENLDKIFAPFYTTKSQGMGVGLSISRSIVEITAGGSGLQRMTVRRNLSVYSLQYH